MKRFLTNVSRCRVCFAVAALVLFAVPGARAQCVSGGDESLVRVGQKIRVTKDWSGEFWSSQVADNIESKGDNWFGVYHSAHPVPMTGSANGLSADSYGQSISRRLLKGDVLTVVRIGNVRGDLAQSIYLSRGHKEEFAIGTWPHFHAGRNELRLCDVDKFEHLETVKPSEPSRQSSPQVKFPFVLQGELRKYCIDKGLRAHTARDFAETAMKIYGAKGIAEIKLDESYELIRAIDADGRRDSFYYSSEGYQRPSDVVGDLWFWSESRLDGYYPASLQPASPYPNATYPIYFNGFNGHIDGDLDSNRGAVTCKAR